MSDKRDFAWMSEHGMPDAHAFRQLQITNAWSADQEIVPLCNAGFWTIRVLIPGGDKIRCIACVRAVAREVGELPEDVSSQATGLSVRDRRYWYAECRTWNRNDGLTVVTVDLDHPEVNLRTPPGEMAGMTVAQVRKLIAALNAAVDDVLERSR